MPKSSSKDPLIVMIDALIRTNAELLMQINALHERCLELMGQKAADKSYQMMQLLAARAKAEAAGAPPSRNSRQAPETVVIDPEKEKELELIRRG